MLDIEIGDSSGQFVDDTSVTIYDDDKRDNEQQDDVGDDEVLYNVLILVGYRAGDERFTVEVPGDDVVNDGRPDGVDERQYPDDADELSG